MERREYLARLDRALRSLTGSRERLDILAYYREYLEEAGPDAAAAAMEALGLPEALARQSVEASPEAPPPRRRTGHLCPGALEACRGGTVLVGLRFGGVRLDVDGAGVRLEPGDVFLVRLEGGKTAWAVEGGVLRVTGGGEAGSLVSITIPRGVRLEEVRLRTRGGDVLVGAVEIGRLNVDAGTGTVELRSTRAGALDLRSKTGISAPDSRVPQRLRGRVSPGKRQANRREWIPMRTNVFLRSTRRQPVRTVFLLLVTALVTFTFVGRASEYLLIEQETTRLAEYYRSVGILTAVTREGRADTSEVSAYLESLSSVRLVEQRRYVSAVMEEGLYNADTLLNDKSSYGTQDLIFYGTLDIASPSSFIFTVDTPLTGRPEYIKAGERITLYGDQTVVTRACGDMETGGRFLVRASSLESGETGVRAQLTKLFQGGPWLLRAGEGQALGASDPEQAAVLAEIEKISANQRALNVIPTKDMRSLPETQEVSPAIYLTEGRWLDSRDNEEGRRACVIHAGFAEVRDLHLGDSIRIYLRDIPSNFGYSRNGRSQDVKEVQVTAEEEYEIVGIYDFVAQYGHTYVRNNVYVPAFAVPESFTYGLSATAAQHYFNKTINSTNGGSIPVAGTVTFQLTSPDREAAFLDRHTGALEEMGYELTILPNNSENFNATVRPMRRASLFNVCVYTVVLLTALCLVDFIYFRARGKELAIVRAMGLPVKRSVRESALPLLLIALPGVLAGGALGWWNTMRTAEETISALTALDTSGGTSAALSPVYLPLFCVGVLALILVLTVGSAVLLAKKPVLEQLQGNTQTAPKRKLRRTVQEPPPPDAAGLSLEAVRAVRTAIPAEQSLWRRAAVVVRFVRRQIVRAPVKSALAGALAAAFAVGLGVIHLAIESDERQIDWLYENTVVRMEILPASDAGRAKNGGFLYENTVQAVEETGLMTGVYLEGASDGAVITDISLWNGGGPLYLDESDMTREGKTTLARCSIRSFSSAADFLSDRGSGSNMAITYFDGWDEALFAQDWTQAVEDQGGETLVPVVIPRKWSAAYGDTGGTIGEPVYRAGDLVLLSCRGRMYRCAVAGVSENSGEMVMLPNSALQAMSGDRMIYSKASFTVDPSQNRDLEQFRAFIDSIANTPKLGSVPVNIAVWDEELTEAVAPLEESLELMRILYPVVFVLSLLTAAGTAVLFVMMSAKDAATLRVLGTPKGRTRLILVLQQAATCFAGLVLGVAGMLIYLQQVRPDLIAALAAPAAWRAAAYLIAAVVGAAASASAVTGKNPLEMLQVRE